MKKPVGRLDFGKMGGLVPVVVVDASTGRVLTQAFADREAVERTVETGYAHFYSRSRRRLWMKGRTSGNRLRVLRVTADCDLDSLVYLAVPEGPACHTGRWTCFHNPLADLGLEEALWRLVVEAFRGATIAVRRGYGGLDEYVYIVNPLTDNIPPPSPLLVSLLVEALTSRVNYRAADKLLVPEALGLPIGGALALRAGLPVAVVRKRRYPVGGLEVEYTSGYEEGTYHIYGVEPGDKLLIFDDAISTGGTLLAILDALEGLGVEVVGITASIVKPQYKGVERVEERGYRVERVVDVYVWRDGRVRLVEPRRGWVEELRLPVTVLGDDRSG